MIRYRRFPSQAYKIIVIISIAWLVSACGKAMVPIKSPMSYPPLIEKTPVTVVIVYSENLKTKKYDLTLGYSSANWTFEPGPPSIEMFNQVFDALFDQVIVVENDYNTLPLVERKNAIEISLISFSGFGFMEPLDGTSIFLKYEATLHDEYGRKVAKWIGAGSAGMPDAMYAEGFSNMFQSTRKLGVVTRLAMRNAVADFLINYENNPDIRQWRSGLRNSTDIQH